MRAWASHVRRAGPGRPEDEGEDDDYHRPAALEHEILHLPAKYAFSGNHPKGHDGGCQNGQNQKRLFYQHAADCRLGYWGVKSLQISN
jgi:hypothetical protein